MTEATAETDRVASLWLAMLHDLTRRSAHDVKNALNGVAVNLEVVRSRLERVGTVPEAVTRFAEVAAGQFEQVAGYVEALLALARPARAPADVAELLAPLRVLLAPVVASPVGAAVATLHPGSAPSAADPQRCRLALGGALLAALDAVGPTAGAGEVVCWVERDAGGAVVARITCGGRTRPLLAPAVESAAGEDGVRCEASPGELTLTFPAAAGRASSFPDQEQA